MKKLIAALLALALTVLSLPVFSVAAVYESPVSLVVTSPKIILYENLDGAYKTSWNGSKDESWFCYTIPEYSLCAQATFSDGTVKQYKYADFFMDATGTYKLTHNQSVNNKWTPGEHTVTLSFLGADAQFTVEVVPLSIERITVHTDCISLLKNIDGSYSEDGSWFCYDGSSLLQLPVTLYMSDGSEQYFENAAKIENKFKQLPQISSTQSASSPWDTGEHCFTYSLFDAEACVEACVIENPCLKIELIGNNYCLTQGVDGTTAYYTENGIRQSYFIYNTELCNFRLRAYFSDGTTSVITKSSSSGEKYKIGCSDDQSAQKPWQPGIHTVSISYMGHTLSADIRIVKNDYKSMEIVSLGADSYAPDEFPDLTGTVLRLYENDDSYDELVLDNSEVAGWSPFSMQHDGTTLTCSLDGDIFTINYLGMSASEKISIDSSHTPESAEIISAPFLGNGTGMSLAVFNTDGSDDIYNIRTVYSANSTNYVLTDNGIFSGYSFNKNSVSNNGNRTYSCIFRKIALTVGESNEMKAGDTVQHYLSYIFMQPDFAAAPVSEFDCVLNEQNTDIMIKTALYLTGDIYSKHTFTSSEIEHALSAVYSKPYVNLSSSRHYNSDTDLYTVESTQLGGYYLITPTKSYANHGGYTFKVVCAETDFYGIPSDIYELYVSLDSNYKLKIISETEFIQGDLNEDGHMNSVDLFYLKYDLLNSESIYGRAFFLLDVNGDNSVNTLDVLHLKLILLGQI